MKQSVMRFTHFFSFLAEHISERIADRPVPVDILCLNDGRCTTKRDRKLCIASLTNADRRFQTPELLLGITFIRFPMWSFIASFSKPSFIAFPNTKFSISTSCSKTFFGKLQPAYNQPYEICSGQLFYFIPLQFAQL